MLEFQFSDFNPFQTKNKYYHWTQRGRVPLCGTIFRTIEGHLADFGYFRRMLITLEQNMLASSALRRSKENNFLYRIFKLKVKTEWIMFSEYCPQH